MGTRMTLDGEEREVLEVTTLHKELQAREEC